MQTLDKSLADKPANDPDKSFQAIIDSEDKTTKPEDNTEKHPLLHRLREKVDHALPVEGGRIMDIAHRVDNLLHNPKTYGVQG